MTEEVWVQSRAFYEISSLGRVRTLARSVVYSNGKIYSYASKTLVTSLHKLGYRYVTIKTEVGWKKIFVHRLVAEGFLPPQEDKPFVNHIDGDKQNNKLLNLEWVSKSENQLHSTKVLKKNMRAKHSHAKLTEDNVVEIRRLLDKKSSLKNIAALYTVSISCVSSIKTGRTWGE